MDGDRPRDKALDGFLENMGKYICTCTHTQMKPLTEHSICPKLPISVITLRK